MDSVTIRKMGFDGMEDRRYTNKRYPDQNRQKKPDFIEDVLFQKDLYSSYNMIQANPAYEPTYTFAEPDSPSTESNPMSLFNETDEQQPLVTKEHSVISDADCSNGINEGDIFLTVDPAFDTVLEDHHYKENPPTHVWLEDMNVNLVPEPAGADKDILSKATFGLCMNQDREGVDLAAIDAPQLVMIGAPMERTIDVSDYEVDAFIPVVQGVNIDLADPKPPHTDNQIITELVDQGVDQKRGRADLDFFDLPQLSMDAIPMDSVLEDPEFEEVSFMQLDRDIMNIDLIISGIDKGNVSEPTNRDTDLSSAGMDMDTSDVLQVDDNEIPTQQTAKLSGLFSDSAIQEAILWERHIDPDPVPRWATPGKPSLEGQSSSKSAMTSRDRHRRPRSLSHGKNRSPTNSSNHSRPSKLFMKSRSPVKSRDHYRRSRSRSVTRSMNNHRRSRCGVYPRDHHRSFNSRSWDNQSRSQPHMKLGRYSRDCNRRKWSRSRSRSRSPVNSRGFNRRARSRSPINLRDPRWHSPRRNRPRQRSPQLPEWKQSQHRRSFSRFSPPLKHHLSPPPPVCRAPAYGILKRRLHVTGSKAYTASQDP